MFVNHLCEAKGEQDGKADKPQESFGELVIASGDAPIALDSFEEVFYAMATPVELCGEWHSRSAVTATGNAGVYSFSGRCLPEGRAITSDEELEQINRYGQAPGGVTPFDEEVHRWAEIHEAHYAKMRAGQKRAAMELRILSSAGAYSGAYPPAENFRK